MMGVLFKSDQTARIYYNIDMQLKSFGNKIEHKLALLLSLVAVISLVVLGYLAVRQIKITREKNIAELEWQLTNQSVERLRKYINDKLETFRIIIADPKVTALGHEQQKYILQGVMQSDNSLMDVSFLNPNDGYEMWREVRVAGIDPPKHRVFGPDDPVVKAIKEANSSYIGPVYFVEREPRLILASPVLNQSGNIIAILKAEVALSALEPIIAHSNLGQDGYLYLVDQAGYIIGSSSNLNLAPAGTDLTSSTLVKKVLAGGAEFNLNEAIKFDSILNQGETYGVGRKIAKLNWGVIVEWPSAEAMNIVPQIVGRLFLASLLLLAVLIMFSIWLARKFAQPILDLKVAADQIGQGRFDVVLKKQSQDEIGDLARSFETMTVSLKELERLKDEFVFIAAHELRTPVTAIRGYAEMLQDTAKDMSEQSKGFVNQLQQAGARLATLVNDLLEVARSQAGRLKVNTTPLDILPIIQNILAELTPLAKEKNHTVVFTPPEALPQVLADKDKLQEVLVNLLSNAIKYTPAGGLITLKLEEKASALLISVKDNGIGISPEDQAKLFQRFFRVESEETKNIQGTGLGLFIVRQIVEHMNGQIWVESSKGQGCDFKFTLPLVK